MVYFSSKFELAAIAVGIASSIHPAVSAPLVARDVEHWGTGCPQDANISVKVDGNKITSSFDRFTVRSSPQSSKTEACSFAVTIGGQAGRQYSPASSCYSDTLNLDSGVTSTHIFTYYFQNSASDTSETRHTFTGPAKGTFDVTDTVASSDKIWSSCGASALLVVQNRGSLVSGDTSKTLYFNDGDTVTTLDSRAC